VIDRTPLRSEIERLARERGYSVGSPHEGAGGWRATIYKGDRAYDTVLGLSRNDTYRRLAGWLSMRAKLPANSCRPGAWGGAGCAVHEGHDIGVDGRCIEGRRLP
jgi:hypothetical protein